MILMENINESSTIKNAGRLIFLINIAKFLLGLIPTQGLT